LFKLQVEVLYNVGLKIMWGWICKIVEMSTITFHFEVEVLCCQEVYVHERIGGLRLLECLELLGTVMVKL
jgi:hypothetical protein